MASYPHHSPDDADLQAAVRPNRRRLLRTRDGGELPPPRVVLHLPDLDALSGIALGPPKPATRRRFDPAHAPTLDRPEADESDAPMPQRQTATLTRIPFEKLIQGWSQAGQTAGRLIVLLQQPKVLLAAIVAVALQFAAVLGMIGGEKAVAPDPGITRSEPAGASPAVPIAGGPDRPIQTPLTLTPTGVPTPAPVRSAPSLSPPSHVPSGPAVVAQPSSPAIDPGQLPAFPTGSGPALVGTPPASNQPAKLEPTPTAPRSASPVRAKLRGTIVKYTDSEKAP